MGGDFCLVFWVSGAWGQDKWEYHQDIDSLKKVLESAHADTIKWRTMYLLSHQLRRYNIDSAIIYSSAAFELSKKLDKQREALTAKTLAYHYAQKGVNQDKARELFTESEQYFREQKDTLNTTKCIYGLCTVSTTSGNFVEASQQAYRGLRIVESYSNPNGEINHLKSSLFYVIGQASAATKDYPKALRAFKNAARIAKENGLHDALSDDYSAIGAVYEYMNELGSAIKYGKKSLAMAEKLSHTQVIARQLGNIGVIFQRQENYDSAVSYFQSSIKEFDKGGMINMAGYPANNLAYSLMMLGKVEEADEVLKLNRKIAVDTDDAYLLYYYYSQRADYHKRKGELQQAYDTMWQVVAYKDTINQRQSKQEIKKIQTIYETEKKDRQLAEQETQLAQEKLKRQRTTLIAMLVGATLIIGLIAALFTIRARTRQREAEAALRAKMESDLQRAELDLEDLVSVQSDLRQYQEELNTTAENFRSMHNQIQREERPVFDLDVQKYRQLPDFPQIEAIVKMTNVFTNRVGEQIERNKDIIGRLKSQQLNLKEKEGWQRVSTAFHEKFPGVIVSLEEQFGKLSKQQKALFMLIYLKAERNEIKQALEIWEESAMKKARQRLSKKLNMESATQLDQWIHDFRDQQN